jgi:hypothetical protein
MVAVAYHFLARCSIRIGESIVLISLREMEFITRSVKTTFENRTVIDLPIPTARAKITRTNCSRHTPCAVRWLRHTACADYMGIAQVIRARVLSGTGDWAARAEPAEDGGPRKLIVGMNPQSPIQNPRSKIQNLPPARADAVRPVMQVLVKLSKSKCGPPAGRRRAVCVKC